MSARRPKSSVPSVEFIERRELLSGLTTNAARTVVELADLRSQALHPTVRAAVLPAESPLQGSGTPTPRELARQRFAAKFAGPSYRGPGRFSDQQATFYLRGTGGSNVFLHGDLNLAVVTPLDSTKPLVGEAVLQDKNINNGSILGLSLEADRSSLDRFGRPTVLKFTSDPNVSGGTFSRATSSGTVKIRYNGHRAMATFTGQLYTIGLTNLLRNADLLSGSGG